MVVLSVFFSGCKQETRGDLMSEAAKYMREGNAKGAAVIFKSLLEKNPNDADARVELTQAYLAAGKPYQAEKEAQKLGEGARPPDTTRLLLGQARLAQGKIAPATADIMAFLTAFPQSAEGWEALGNAHMAGKDMAFAESDYARSLTLNPDRVKARLGLIKAKLGLGRFAEAEAQLDAFLGRHPTDQAGLHLLARLQAQKGDKHAAAATYAAIAAKYPRDYKAKYAGAHLALETGEATKEIEDAAQGLMDNFPDEPEGFKLQGLIDIQKGDFAKAVPRFQEALRIRPDIETSYFLAVAFARAKDLESAVSTLQIVLDHAPAFTEASRLMAWLHMAAGRPEQAIAVLDKALAATPDDPLLLSMLGDIYLGEKNLDKSFALFGEIPDDSVQAGGAHLKKGVILSAKGDLAGAQAEFRKAVEVSNKKFEPKVYLATLLARQGKLAEAMATLDAPNAPAQVQALMLDAQAALLFEASGHEDEALGKLTTAASLDPAQATSHRLLARYFLRTNQPDKALPEYQAILAILPKDLEALSGLLKIQAAAKQWPQAEKTASDIITLSPADARNYLPLAMIKKNEGDLDGVKDVMARALKADPANIKAQFGFAQSLLKMGEREDALYVLNTLVKDNPALAAGYALRGLVREQSGDPDGAAGDYESALRLKPGLSMALNNLAMIYADKPNLTAKAVELAQSALDVDHDNPLVMDTLGYAMLKNGQTSEAQNILRRAANIAPSNGVIAGHLKSAEAGPQ